MASINQSFEDSEDIGELEPGWTVNTSATPHVIGEAAGGTGTVSSQYSARENSLFTINDNISTSLTLSKTTPLERKTNFIGQVKSVSQTGNNVSISHSTQLDKYDAEYSIPPLTMGGIAPVLDIASHLVGDSGISDAPGWGTSLCGHSNAFDKDGNQVFGESKTTSYTYYDPTLAKNVTQDVSYLRNTVWANDFKSLYGGKQIYANGVVGDSFSPIPTEANVEYLQYDFQFDVELDEFGEPTSTILPHSWGFSGNPIDNDFDYGFECGVSIAADGIITAGFDVTEGGTPVEYKSVAVGGFFAYSTYKMYIRFSYGPDVSGSSKTRFYLDVEIQGNFAPIKLSANIALSVAPTWYSSWGINGLVRSLYRYSEAVELQEPVPGIIKYNYIVNNDFETNTTGWTTVSDGSGTTALTFGRTSAYNSANFPHGSWAYQSSGDVPVGPISSRSYDVKVSTKNFLKDPNGYDAVNIFSFYAKKLPTPNTYFVIDFQDQNATYLNTYSASLNDDWTRYDFEVTIPADVTELFITIKVCDNYNLGTFGMVIDAVQLENYYTYSDTTPHFGLTNFWNASIGTNGNTSREYITNNGQTYSMEYYLNSPLGEYDKPYYIYTNKVDIWNSVESPAVAGVRGNLWEYLQNACAAYGQYISMNSSGIYAYPIEIYLDKVGKLSEYSPSPSITPTSSFSGRSVDIVYTNASVASGTEVYDAYDDGNKIITVKSKETVTVIINSNSYLNSVIQPIRKFSLPNAEGYFIVSDSTGMPVGGTNANRAWEDYGGKVEVSVNPDIPGAINIKVTGPFQEIPAYPGPYKLAYSDGSNDYAALSILGNGVKTDNKTLNLQTGAVRAKTKQEVAKTVTNPFIGTLEQAYDRGIWASADASGPKISMSATTSEIYSYGNYIPIPNGWTIEYGYSKYRIMDSTVSRAGTSFNAQRYVTVWDRDSKWTGKTVSYHDGVWSKYKLQDQIIAPFKNIDIINGYISFDPSDQNPYFSFAKDGSGEAELLFDTDGTPYYSYLYGSNSATLLELDTDFTPYYD